jgi:hypothetical protein
MELSLVLVKVQVGGGTPTRGGIINFNGIMLYFG